MKIKNYILATLLLTIAISSCVENHYYYMPDLQNVPQFTGKQQFNVNGALGLAKNLGLVNASAAYSITNHIEVLAQYTNIGFNKTLQDSIVNSTKYNYYNGAIGYFKSINEYIVTQLIAGVGKGNEQHSFIGDILSNTYIADGNANIKYIKPYLQPSVGFINKNVEYSFSTQFSDVNYYGIKNNVYFSNPAFAEVNNIAKNHNNFMIEPSFNLSAGFENFKFQVQFLRSFNLSNSSIRQIQTPLNFGIVFAFKNKK